MFWSVLCAQSYNFIGVKICSLVPICREARDANRLTAPPNPSFFFADYMYQLNFEVMKTWLVSDIIGNLWIISNYYVIRNCSSQMDWNISSICICIFVLQFFPWRKSKNLLNLPGRRSKTLKNRLQTENWDHEALCAMAHGPSNFVFLQRRYLVALFNNMWKVCFIDRCTQSLHTVIPQLLWYLKLQRYRKERISISRSKVSFFILQFGKSQNISTLMIPDTTKIYNTRIMIILPELVCILFICNGTSGEPKLKIWVSR